MVIAVNIAFLLNHNSPLKKGAGRCFSVLKDLNTVNYMIF